MNPFFTWGKLEDLSQNEVAKDQIMKLINNRNHNKVPGWNICLRGLEECKCLIARVFTMVHKADLVPPGIAVQYVHIQSRKGMNNKWAEFANDTKVFGTVSSNAVCEFLQRLLWHRKGYQEHGLAFTRSKILSLQSSCWAGDMQIDCTTSGTESTHRNDNSPCCTNWCLGWPVQRLCKSFKTNEWE